MSHYPNLRHESKSAAQTPFWRAFHQKPKQRRIIFLQWHAPQRPSRASRRAHQTPIIGHQPQAGNRPIN
jgi:hypothetical protein